MIANGRGCLLIFATVTGNYTKSLAGYMIPKLIGNTAGGVALVAWLNHAQVANDSER